MVCRIVVLTRITATNGLREIVTLILYADQLLLWLAKPFLEKMHLLGAASVAKITPARWTNKNLIT